ncbi:hypothetical protein GCM10010174_05010 [Kutzneria viridogrisea]|uniref:HTH tetR-type domain-containing protein n=2 Tax=Kutzneria TaxID=43356 RepID=W5WGK6_9PSEU|nr:TetR/AcrR family transcriptional regulator [Kutzneria albida]AHH99992.1 hypothetical protein KALB_6633 [Kutzneria albida DSM 43870]MBA8925172.1 AcrR family transcriptional regulator [Kutzneria viridogrisea]
MSRPLRSDAERTVRAILRAADKVLSENPGATLQQIAEVAGVARTTVHRRFATREALIEAMNAAMLEQIEEAIDAARPRTAPVQVGLHAVTANLIRVKSSWRFTGAQFSVSNPDIQCAAERVQGKSELLFDRLTESGLLAPQADRDWTVRTYHALLHQAILRHQETGEPAEALADLVVTTLLGGLGTSPG